MKYPLTIALSITSVLVAAAGLYGRGAAYAAYAGDPVKETVVSLPLKALRDGVYPWSASTAPVEVAEAAESDGGQDAPPDADETPEGDGQASADGAAGSADGDASSRETAADADSPDAPAHEDASSSASTAGEEQPEEDIPSYDEASGSHVFTTVKDSYFADALFIGDSRTVGLHEYCPDIAEYATFYCQTSMTIYGVMETPFMRSEVGKISVEEALQYNQFKKIYIMLGINEMGTGNDQRFVEQYARVIDRIQELQPDAIIYVQAIMHVTAEKSAKDPIFNNGRIDQRNQALSLLANNSDVFYIDMNEAIDDENGNMKKELSYDDIHLLGSSYELWHQFLLTHAVAVD